MGRLRAMSAEVMTPSEPYSTVVTPQTSEDPVPRMLTPFPIGPPTKAKVTAPPVADVHAVTSSGVPRPLMATRTGRAGQRTVRPSLNWALC